MAKKKAKRTDLEALVFKTFLQSLTVAKIKELIDQYNGKLVKINPKKEMLKGYSSFKKEQLVEFIDSSLNKKEKNEMREQFEPEFVHKIVTEGLSLISGENKVEKIQNAGIIAGGKGYNIWFTSKYGSNKASLKIDKNSVDRSCSCKIGKPGGLCLHQMAIYLMLISKKVISTEDLPFSVDKVFLDSTQKRLDLLATQSLFKEDPAIMFEDDYKIYINEDLVTLDWGGDHAGKTTKDISKEEEDTETWIIKKIVNLILKDIKVRVKTGKPFKLILDSYGVVSKIMDRQDQVNKILKKFAVLDDPNLPTNEASLETYLKSNLKESTGELAIEPPFAAYMGNKPYTFVSYTHKDKAEVYPILEKLHKKGFDIWYDEGIPLSTDWCNTIAENLLGCCVFLSFISPFVSESDNTQDEIHLALNEKKSYLAIYLRETDLTPGLKMRVRRVQGIIKYEMEDAKFYSKLITDLKQIFENVATINVL